MDIFKEFRKNNRLILPHDSHHETGGSIVRISGVSVYYDGNLALDRVSFELNPGEQIAVVGPNGAGKSTLFKVIAGVLKPGEGRIDVFGSEPGGHICIAYLPQRSQVDWNFPVNVGDVVMMGRISKLGLLRQPRKSDWEIVRQALSEVGMQELIEYQISELSGGQQQRMFIARALAQEAELMLMDEPLSGLDPQSQEDIFAILKRLRQRNVTILVAMHDLKTASERFDRVLLLNRRLVGFGEPDKILTAERLIEAYGGRLRLVPTSEGLMTLEDTCCDEGGDLQE